MKFGAWQWLKRLPATLAAARPETWEHAELIVTLQRNIIMPARLLVVAFVFYYIYTRWLSKVVSDYGVIFETIQNTFAGCALFTVATAVLFYVPRRFPPGAVQWLVFVIGLGDGVFLGGLTVLTGGFESILYWVYPCVIVLNAISIPLATPQIVLNLALSIFFLLAGLIETNARAELSLPAFPLRKPPPKISAENIKDLPTLVASLKQSPNPIPEAAWEQLPESARAKLSASLWGQLSEPMRAKLSADLSNGAAEGDLKKELADELNRIISPPRRYFMEAEPPEVTAAPYVLRVAVLMLLTFCCYGLQVLVAAQQRAEEEQKEFLVRTEQLRGAGRLAAEFAHQIKNPLAIINNAVFSLQRGLKNGRTEIVQPLQIIQEEVARADQIITQIMGYAQLSEGRVEKLDVRQELDRATDQVFPRGITTGIELHRDFAPEFPPLLMQRRHLAECLANLLLNAREAVGHQGNVFLTATVQRDQAVEITVRDDGPGIAPDKLERVFEAYYTTKDRGTGLGLAIVKHNVELYAGSVRVESVLGQGAKFILLFPAKTWMKPGP